MRHNHKNHIGSSCRFVDVFDVLPNWKNRNSHRSPKSEKPRCFCQKTENQMLKKGKTGNHNGQQNRKTEVFHCKNRKTDLENGQNRKTENPNASLIKCFGGETSIIHLALSGKRGSSSSLLDSSANWLKELMQALVYNIINQLCSAMIH